jgi:GTP:adenosylcobinamide-phosphate guanylyltransferase
VGELDALILAGGHDKSFAKEYVADAAFAINGESMLDRVVQAIVGVGRFDKVIVVGMRAALQAENQGLVTAFVEPRATMDENLRAGLDALGGDQLTLIVASDIPLLDSGAINDFLQQCAVKPGADIYYPVIPREVFTKVSPKIHRTFLRLREGVFTGGNMALVRPHVILNHFDQVRQIFKLRKTPRQWAKLLGWGYFLKGLCFGVGLTEIERRLEERLKIKGVAICCQSLGIGLDADSEEDIGWIRFYWGDLQEPSVDLQRVLSVIESVQTQINRGDLAKAQISVTLEAGKSWLVSVDKQ